MTTIRTRTAALAAATALVGGTSVWGAGPASAATEPPDRFTSAYTVDATGDTIVDSSGAAVGGQPGATGTFNISIDSTSDTICWDMDIRGLDGSPQSSGDAVSGVLLREAPASWGGPPRIAVPAPEREGDRFTGEGCAQGPFTTGVQAADGRDSATWFTLADVEASPATYAVDVRTAAYPEGAIRGQLSPVPVGAPDTGFGGGADAGSALRTGLGIAAAAAVGAAGVMGWRRTRLEP